jgi:hypothetical protein
MYACAHPRVTIIFSTKANLFDAPRNNKCTLDHTESIAYENSSPAIVHRINLSIVRNTSRVETSLRLFLSVVLINSIRDHCRCSKQTFATSILSAIQIVLFNRPPCAISTLFYEQNFDVHYVSEPYRLRFSLWYFMYSIMYYLHDFVINNSSVQVVIFVLLLYWFY